MTRKYDGKVLAKVLAYYDLLQSDNMEFNILCPFHNDHHESMKVNLYEGNFFCFTCRATGDAFDFVRMLHPEYNELEICIMIEKILRSKKVVGLNIKRKPKKRINHIKKMEEAQDYYYGLKKTDWNHIQTEEEREVLEYMQNRGFNADDLNIVRCKVDYKKAYPALFPIFENNVFRGHVSRTTNKEVEKYRKYLNNEGLYKRDLLCGYYGEKDYVFVCEGYFDFMSFYVKGRMKQCVALFGWHMSDMQAKKLKDSGIKYIICALDNPLIDECGARGLANVKKFFETVVEFPYPENKKDAGEMSEEELEKAIKKSLEELEKMKNENGNNCRC